MVVENDIHSTENSETTDQDEITTDEIIEAINMLKRGRPAGNDGITTDMVKNMDENGMEILKILFNKIWNEQNI